MKLEFGEALQALGSDITHSCLLEHDHSDFVNMQSMCDLEGTNKGALLFH